MAMIATVAALIALAPGLIFATGVRRFAPRDATGNSGVNIQDFNPATMPLTLAATPTPVIVGSEVTITLSTPALPTSIRVGDLISFVPPPGWNVTGVRSCTVHLTDDLATQPAALPATAVAHSTLPPTDANENSLLITVPKGIPSGPSNPAAAGALVVSCFAARAPSTATAARTNNNGSFYIYDSNSVLIMRYPDEALHTPAVEAAGGGGGGDDDSPPERPEPDETVATTTGVHLYPQETGSANATLYYTFSASKAVPVGGGLELTVTASIDAATTAAGNSLACTIDAAAAPATITATTGYPGSVLTVSPEAGVSAGGLHTLQCIGVVLSSVPVAPAAAAGAVRFLSAAGAPVAAGAGFPVAGAHDPVVFAASFLTASLSQGAEEAALAWNVETALSVRLSRPMLLTPLPVGSMLRVQLPAAGWRLGAQAAAVVAAASNDTEHAETSNADYDNDGDGAGGSEATEPSTVECQVIVNSGAPITVIAAATYESVVHSNSSSTGSDRVMVLTSTLPVQSSTSAAAGSGTTLLCRGLIYRPENVATEGVQRLAVSISLPPLTGDAAAAAVDTRVLTLLAHVGEVTRAPETPTEPTVGAVGQTFTIPQLLRPLTSAERAAVELGCLMLLRDAAGAGARMWVHAQALQRAARVLLVTVVTAPEEETEEALVATSAAANALADELARAVGQVVGLSWPRSTAEVKTTAATPAVVTAGTASVRRIAATCFNGVHDSSSGESDVDCGRTCGMCADSRGCSANIDCLSGTCSAAAAGAGAGAGADAHTCAPVNVEDPPSDGSGPPVPTNAASTSSGSSSAVLVAALVAAVSTAAVAVAQRRQRGTACQRS
jgi:hypothetical protein